MYLKTEIFLIVLSVHSGELRILVKKDPQVKHQVLPSAPVKNGTFQRGAQEALLKDLFGDIDSESFEQWMSSSRYRDRIVDVYDRDLLFEGAQNVSVVRAVAVPEELAVKANGTWLPVNTLFSEDSVFSADCKLFLKDFLELVPRWVRHTTLCFELLPAVFSIQDLRLLVGALSGNEIDAGNFHRRLKKLDILNPMVSGQRVHRWEFNWSRSAVLKDDGLIP